MSIILAADIGATNCRFALFQADRDTPGAPLLRMLREKWVAGADYAEFRHALRILRVREADGGPPFLDDSEKPVIAVLAPAGPIEGDTCRLSNLPWVIRGRDVREELGAARVALINDFAAQAYACLMPDHMDAVEVLPGGVMEGASVAVVGAGTGLGHALIMNGAATAFPGGDAPDPEAKARLLRGMRRAKVLPSEAGHSDFPFAGGREQDFADFVRRSAGIDRIIGDTVVTGSGLAHIYAFLTGERLPPHEVPARLDACPEALEWFARFYGRGCRNYVLSTLALGGLYVTGGMALRAPVLEHPVFAEEFHHSAAHGPLLRKVPIWHIRKAQAGLWGAAVYGMLEMWVEEGC